MHYLQEGLDGKGSVPELRSICALEERKQMVRSSPDNSLTEVWGLWDSTSLLHFPPSSLHPMPQFCVTQRQG